MVHSVKLTWKWGLGFVSAKHAARLDTAVEFGYFVGSLLFAFGTVFFFPVEDVEDFRLGCRFYEMGSVLFMGLTGYVELDRYYARRLHSLQADESRTVTKRELIEELLYCLGSFVFLVGTFLFDPPIVEVLADILHARKSIIENSAAILFMVGSFLFSLGSYVNALSIFEAPSKFRSHLISVTTCYQFGGLFFIAGTMGYVEAFEPNLTMKWVSTWFYMVGCFFYVAGSALAFVSTVASHQIQWERVRDRERKKQRRMASLVGRATGAIPRAFKAAARRRKPRFQNGEEHEQNGGDEDNISLEDLAESPEAPESGEHVDIELAEGQLTEQLTAVLGPEAGPELIAALRGSESEEEDIFGAFWRSVLSSPFAHPATEGPSLWSPKNHVVNLSPKAAAATSTLPVIAEENGRGFFNDDLESAATEPQSTVAFRDNVSLKQNRG